MKIFDPKRHLPVGWDWENTQAKLFLWHGLSTMTLIGFLNGYIDARSLLYSLVPGPTGTYIPELDPTRTILPFWDLLGGTPLWGLWIFLAMMPLLVWRYYHSHTQGTMAVYTMRRLPDPTEYHLRCWTQPVLSALAELALYAVLIGLCWLIWYFATPAPCRPF